MDLSWLAALITAVVPVAPGAAALPPDPAPRVPYAAAQHPVFGGGDWRLVRPTGTTSAFAESTGAFIAFEDVVVNGFGTEGGFVVQLYDGTPVLEHEQAGLCHDRLLTTPERDEVAWLQDDGSLVELHDTGSVDTRPVELPGGPCGAAQPAALRGPKLYVDGPHASPSVIAGPNHPGRIRLLSGLADVSGRGLLAGRLASDPTCSGLLRPRHGVRWETCADRLTSFSPDGHHLLGLVGVEPRDVVVHHVRTGRVTARWPQGSWTRVAQVEWEDAGHLLAVVRERGVGWSIMRLGVDGAAQRAVGPLRSGAEFPPYRLQLS
jgi:hypothetical protein